MIGIIVAMESELRMMLDIMHNTTDTTIDGTSYYIGKITDSDNTTGNKEVVLSKCGIGKVNAACGALNMINNFKPSLIVNTGIAGGTGRGAGILDVVIADKVAYHDVYCGPGNAPGQVQGLPEQFDCATDLVDCTVYDSLSRIKRGMIASGDKFISTPQELAAVLEVQPQAIAVDMESGAIAQVCHMKHVPFIAVRVVSDTPGAPDHISQYENFWELAPKSAFSVLTQILDNLHSEH